MKALIVADDERAITNISEVLKTAGYDSIVYKWLLKALDNIEEIAPHLIVVSTKDYPRHWKTLAQYASTGFGDYLPEIILFADDNFPEDELKKAETLRVRGIFYSVEVEGLDKLREILTKKPDIFSGYLTDPEQPEISVSDIIPDFKKEEEEEVSEDEPESSSENFAEQQDNTSTQEIQSEDEGENLFTDNSVASEEVTPSEVRQENEAEEASATEEISEETAEETDSPDIEASEENFEISESSDTYEPEENSISDFSEETSKADESSESFLSEENATEDISEGKTAFKEACTETSDETDNNAVTNEELNELFKSSSDCEADLTENESIQNQASDEEKNTDEDSYMPEMSIEDKLAEIMNANKAEEKEKQAVSGIVQTSCSFVFTNPVTLAMVSGTARGYNGMTLEFSPDIANFIMNLGPGTQIDTASIKIDGKIEDIKAEVMSNDGNRLFLQLKK